MRARDGGFFDAGVERDAGAANADPCWTGPTGTREGDVIENVVLYDCDDEVVELHDLCERRAAHLFILAGW